MAKRSSQCCAKLCTKCHAADENEAKISLHRLPKEKRRLFQWLEAVGRQDLQDIPPQTLYNSYRLCSKHFSSDMYNDPPKLRLKWNAIPKSCKSHHDHTGNSIEPSMQSHFMPCAKQISVTSQYQQVQQVLASSNLSHSQHLICSSDKSTLMASLHSLPINLVLQRSSLNENGYGIWSQEDLPKGIKFGPYRGFPMEDQSRQQTTELNAKGDDEFQPNWLLHINHAPSKEQQNLVVFHFQEEIFYISCKNIPASTELLFGYKYEQGQDDVNESSWFAFKSLLFLWDKNKVQQTLSTIDEELKESVEETPENAAPTDTEISLENASSPEMQPPTKQRKKSRYDEKLDQAFQILSKAAESAGAPKEETECQIFGNLVAKKLQKYSCEVQTAVQRDIMNILFRADAGHYPSPSHIPPSHSQNLTPSNLQYSMAHQSQVSEQDPIYQRTESQISQYALLLPTDSCHSKVSLSSYSTSTSISPNSPSTDM